MAEGSQSGNGHWHRSVNKGTAISGRGAGSNRMGYDGAKNAGKEGQEGKGINVYPQNNQTRMGFGVYSTSLLGGPITGAVMNGVQLDLETILKYVMGNEKEATEAPKDASKGA